MATTIAISAETHDWLSRVKREAGLRSYDEVLGALAQCGQHMAGPLLAKHEAAVAAVCKRHGIRSLTAFGSRAWGAPHAASDLDLVASFARKPSMFALMDAEDDLAEALGVPVDLHMWSTLKPRLARRVRARGHRVFG